MKATKTLIITLALMLAGSGCVVVSGGGSESGEADLTVLYTFGGIVLDSAIECNDLGINMIRVEVNGVGNNEGSVNEERCSAFYQGMTIKNLPLGRYDVRVKAFDSSGRVLYKMNSPQRVTLTKDGTEIDLDLPALYGSLTVYWNSFGEFEGSYRCTDAEITEVRALLYDSQGQLVADDYLDCTHGGITWDYMETGNWEVLLNGLDVDDNAIFAAEASVTVTAGQDTAIDMDLEMIVGDLTFYWRFNGSTSCGEAHEIQVRLYDPWGEMFDSNAYPCDYGGLDYLRIPAGEWVVKLDAIGANNRIIYRTPMGGVSLTVTLGQHESYFVDLYFLDG